jgi:hypothetical protein
MNTFTIKNPHDHAVTVGKTILAKHEQLTGQTMTPDIAKAKAAGDIELISQDETPAERKATAALFTPNYHTGDPAIDGPKKR